MKTENIMPEKSTMQLTKDYIKDHPDIKNCLKKGLINYSSLARLVAKELHIEKKTSKEAILIAARRFKETLKDEVLHEQKIRDILKKSELDIKNKIEVFILEKQILLDSIDDLQKTIRKENGIFYLLEGSNSYTLIVQEKYSDKIKNQLKNKILANYKNLVMINFKSPNEIEEVRGVIAFVTSLFSENDVNIVEFFSCWKDTLFIIQEDDLVKAISFLKF